MRLIDVFRVKLEKKQKATPVGFEPTLLTELT